MHEKICNNGILYIGNVLCRPEMLSSDNKS